MVTETFHGNVNGLNTWFFGGPHDSHVKYPSRTRLDLNELSSSTKICALFVSAVIIKNQGRYLRNHVLFHLSDHFGRAQNDSHDPPFAA